MTAPSPATTSTVTEAERRYRSRVMRAWTCRLRSTRSRASAAGRATIAVEAYDADRNRSDRVRITVSTAACQDVRPPSPPTGFRQQATTRDSVILVWNASTDDVGVVGYGVYRGLQRIASSAEPVATLNGLGCGSTYSYAVDAVDAAGNRSPLATAYVETASCSDGAPPSAPTDLTVTSRTTTGPLGLVVAVER